MIATSDLRKYLHDAKVLDLKEKLTKQGYTVQTDYHEGGFVFDLFAIHDASGQKLYVEVKSSPTDNKRVAQMSTYVKKNSNAKFQLVVVSPPPPQKN